jgi:hypothetical protein
MVSVLVEIPAELWERAKQHYGNKNPRTQLRMIIDQLMFQEDGFKHKIPWANGKGMPLQKVTAIKDDEKILTDVEVLLSAPKPIHSYTAAYPQPTYWSSEEKLKTQIHVAVREFKRTCFEFCLPQFAPNLEKSPDQVEAFLEDIEGQEYSDLTQPMQNFLNYIRQIHRHWWKTIHK